ncbi:MAG: hypothetical protein K9M56_10220 [Victivallales bacterium]|nr:hypothetical protein [Victivallales bacterium]
MKKKILAVLISTMLACSAAVFAESGKSESASQENMFNSKLESAIKTAQKMKKVYKDKAAKVKQENKPELAAAYMACSKAKEDIYNSANGFFTSCKKACSIAERNQKLKPLIETHLDYYKKGEWLTTRIKKLEKCREDNIDKPEFAEAVDSMAKNLEAFSESEKKFTAAHAELRKLKK